MAAFSKAIDDLVAFYLSHACPCRFPRFRATVARDVSVLLSAPEYVNPEQQLLIDRFDALVTLADRSSVPRGWRGRCTRCGADVVREDLELDAGPACHLFITPSGAADVGAPFADAIPQVHGFFPLDRSGGSPRVEAELRAAFPHMDWEQWLAWMRERVA
jgi:hypothetical protein